MAKSPEVITIDSSGDESRETDEDEVICLGAHACVKMEPNNIGNVAIYIDGSPEVKRDTPSFKIDKAKLDSLRKRVGNSIKSNDSPASKMERLGVVGGLKINKKRLRNLKAHVKVELLNYAPQSPCLKNNGKMVSSRSCFRDCFINFKISGYSLYCSLSKIIFPFLRQYIIVKLITVVRCIVICCIPSAQVYFSCFLTGKMLYITLTSNLLCK